MAIFAIPDPEEQKRLEKQQIIPETVIEKYTKPNYPFTSLTDHFGPKGQYTRPLTQQSTHDVNILNEHIQRLKKLIESRGKYVFLVKRKLDGPACDCYNPITKTLMRHECTKCYGTRVIGGYNLYKSDLTPDGKIIIASPFVEEQITWETYGREFKEESTAFWTLPYIPFTQSTSSTLGSYDFFIDYNEDGSELGRYYITAVKPSRSINNKITYQVFTAHKADPNTYGPDGSIHTYGDLIYRIDISKLEVITGEISSNPDTLHVETSYPNQIPSPDFNGR